MKCEKLTPRDKAKTSKTNILSKVMSDTPSVANPPVGQEKESAGLPLLQVTCAKEVLVESSERDGLECVFSGTTTFPAVYQESNGAVSCDVDTSKVSNDQENPLCHLKVRSRAGRAVFEQDSFRLPGKDIAAPYAAQHADTDAQDRRTQRKALLPFAIISLSYILFTTTDGGVRIIVLLHAYQQGFTALQLAAIFAGYELAGVIVNLLAGLAGARWGIKTTLLAGLSFQLVAFGMLFGWQNSWHKGTAIAYIAVSQVLNGVAKDLTKLGGKTVGKLVTPDEKQMRLFRLVAWITGFKNSAKGLGYLLGAVLLTVNYYAALAVMVGLILLAYPWAVVGLSNQLGRTRKENIRFAELFNNSHNIKALSAARFFLFASRDLWFEVTLPYFLRSTASGIGWSRTLVGAYLAVWIILYGQVQSWSPGWILKPLHQVPPNKWVAVLWAAVLVACPAIMAAVLLGSDVFGVHAHKVEAIAVLTVILYTFCVIFAINSAVHSYLIVKYADGNKVAMNVGFYYMSNAAGRLVGTLLSGVLYTYVGDSIVQGFGACFMASVVFVMLSSALAVFIRDDAGGLQCGPCLQLRRRPDMVPANAVLQAPSPAEVEMTS